MKLACQIRTVCSLCPHLRLSLHLFSFLRFHETPRQQLLKALLAWALTLLQPVHMCDHHGVHLGAGKSIGPNQVSPALSSGTSAEPNIYLVVDFGQQRGDIPSVYSLMKNATLLGETKIKVGSRTVPVLTPSMTSLSLAPFPTLFPAFLRQQCLSSQTPPGC